MEPLFDMRDEPRPLTERQARIYQHIVDSGGDGVPVDELGAWLHSWRHGPDLRCEFCSRDGLRAVHERAIADRIVKRGHAYVAIDVREKVVEERPASSQIDELPGGSFEEIFGDAV